MRSETAAAVAAAFDLGPVLAPPRPVGGGQLSAAAWLLRRGSGTGR